MTHLTDDDLIRMYRDGDADAFDVLFDRYHVSVYSFAVTMLGATYGADEVLQDTFLAVARTARTYTPRGRFRAWVMRIARNRCLNQIAARRAREAVAASHPLVVPATGAQACGPAETVMADETHAAVRAAIGSLPDRQREAVILYAFEHMRYREIAEVLDVPINTVKTLIRRARMQLARCLAAKGVDGVP